MCDFEKFEEFLDRRDREFAAAKTPAAKARFIEIYGQDAWDWLQSWENGEATSESTPR